MRIVRYKSGRGIRLEIWVEDEVIDLASVNETSFNSFIDLAVNACKKKLSLKDFVMEVTERNSKDLARLRYKELNKPDKDGERLVIPLDPPEVWGCEITYKKSRTAREFETGTKGIYDLVYNAERPEIFLKGTADRCVGPNDEICVRGDSNWSVPEAELAFILGPDHSIIEFTAGNDVSARDIEGENPLYLPQARIFKGCCALDPSIVTVDEVGSEPKLKIECEILRSGESIFKDSTNTSVMKRTIEELRSYLCRYNPVPVGTVCLTGTGIVPPEEFSLQQRDIVDIRIEKIGTLRNRVKRLKAYSHLLKED